MKNKCKGCGSTREKKEIGVCLDCLIKNLFDKNKRIWYNINIVKRKRKIKKRTKGRYKMARYDHFTISEFHCTLCGAKGMPIPRKQAKQKGSCHLKKLYCLNCKCETNHVEVREFDYDLDDLMEDIANGVYANPL